MPDRLDWDTDGRDWPNREASRFVEAGGMRWHVQCAGDRRRPVVVLLHGTGASSHSWRDLLPLLAEHAFVVAPDLPGHGFSGTPADRSGFTLPGMARGVSELLRALRLEPQLIAGHSAGAAVAVQICLDGLATPQALLGLNAALLPMPGVVGSMFSPMARTLAVNPLVPRLFAWGAAWPGTLSRLLEGTGSELDARGRELYGRLVRSPAHVAAALAMMAGWDLDTLARRLPELRCPMHLVVGERDRTLPPDLAWQAAQRIPGCRVTRLDGLGHLAHEERPADVARLLTDLLAPHPPP